MKSITPIILYILILALPVFVFNKLMFIFVALILYFIAKVISLIITKKFSFTIGTFDMPVLLIALSYLLSTALKTPNVMEALILPGTTTIIVLSVITYFLVNQLDLYQKKILTYILISSACLTSIVILLSVTGIIKLGKDFNPTGSFLTSAIFLLAILPICLTQILKESEFLSKFLIGVSTLITLFAFLVSIYLIVPNRPLSPKLLPISTSLNIALGALKESPILGIGPGNYLTAFNKYKGLEFNKTDLWAVKFASGSNFLITTFTETGILGTMAFVALIVNTIYVGYKKLKERKLVGWGLWASFDIVSLVILLASFLLFPMTIVTMMTFFTLLGILSDKKKETSHIWIVTLAGVLFLFYFGYNFILAEYNFAKAVASVSKNNAPDTYQYVKEAIRLNHKVDRYHLFLSKINYALAASLAQKENLTDSQKNQVTLLVQDSINEGREATLLNIDRADNWEALGKTYQTLIPLANGSGTFAVESYKKATSLEPTNPTLRIALGDIYFLAKDYKNAIENYKLAISLKEDLANAHYNLALAYKSNKEIDKSQVEFAKTLSLLDKNSEDYKKVKEELEKLQTNF